ncbi:EF-hand domain-containing protein [Ramlibacter alkalitolerans]|uniref:EF-hand domain-containing protein n=1 Tax=Ramlibacter alkalitolerans TaxID=2039631 RepID=A0ABS1JQ62_9BURK|nr:EF-hand domain-containing protein [Ramlibacter alkalitolerans]MBL0425685.1 hypothetical protein [Ramlibacter alkalitolerans]
MLASTRLAAALVCALAAASAVQAQTTRAPSRVQPAANVVPSNAARIAQTAPRPTGLISTFPAGISSGSGAAVATNPIAQSVTPIPPTGSSLTTGSLFPNQLPPADSPTTTTNGVLVPGTTIVSPGAGIVNPTNAATPTVATNVLGAGATVRGPGQSVGGAGGFSATDQARSFFFADSNHDGDITRAEFGRLSIATMTFEEMDRNYDGVISRFEYDDSTR